MQVRQVNLRHEEIVVKFVQCWRGVKYLFRVLKWQKIGLFKSLLQGINFQWTTAVVWLTKSFSIVKERPLSVDIIVEPNFVALGPFHLAVGMNNRAWFYSLADKGIEQYLYMYVFTMAAYTLRRRNFSCICKVRSTVHTDPSRKHSFSKTLFEPEEFENIGFTFFVDENINSTTLPYSYDKSINDRWL